MGSDKYAAGSLLNRSHFNPRSPHGERPSNDAVNISIITFQSTLPAWGATVLFLRAVPVVMISIHAPRMGSDVGRLLDLEQHKLISIHAPRMGSDKAKLLGSLILLISIHAPRMGSDQYSQRWRPSNKFQSTLPAWGATT